MSWKETYSSWEREAITDGEALDELLNLYLVHLDPDLVKYITAMDGDNLTDAEAIDLVHTRLQHF